MAPEKVHAVHNVIQCDCISMAKCDNNISIMSSVQAAKVCISILRDKANKAKQLATGKF